MGFNIRGICVLFLVVLLSPLSLRADCEPGHPRCVQGTFTVGDGSVPPTNSWGALRLYFTCGGERLEYGYDVDGGPFPGPFSAYMPLLSISPLTNGHCAELPCEAPGAQPQAATWEFHGWTAIGTQPNHLVLPYFGGVQPGASCTPGPTCPDDYSCQGSFAILFHASLANVRGRVTYPDGTPPPPGTAVFAFAPWSATPVASRPTNADGEYDFVATGCNYDPPSTCATNNWGLSLLEPPVSPPSGAGPYFAEYTVGVGSVSKDAPNAQRAMLESSKLAVKDLLMPGPDPSRRSCPAAGEPVSVATGNVFFDQTDADIPSFGPGLHFTRSYNSHDTEGGTFGQGWRHSYEERLTSPASGTLMLMGGDGVPRYFRIAGDGSYRPSVPLNKDTWITGTLGAGLTRHYRRGGTDVFDNQGRLARRNDPVGNWVELTYDAQHRLAMITAGPSGSATGSRSLTLGYPAGQAQPSSLSGPAGVIANYSYSNNKLTSVTYPDSADDGSEPDGGYTFSYFPTTGYLDTVQDLTGRILESHSYYPDGRALTSTLSKGHELYTFVYGDNQTTVTDALNNVTKHEWTLTAGTKVPTRVTGPCSSCGGHGDSQEWTYYPNGLLETRKDAAGIVTRYTYDATTMDLLSETIEPPGIPASSYRTTTYTYHPDGRLWTRTDPNAARTTYQYDSAGVRSIQEQVSETVVRSTAFTYTLRGQLETITDPRGKVTRMDYHAETGDLWKVTDPLGVATPNDPDDHLTRFEYDLLGRRIQVTDPTGNVTRGAYDGPGRIISTTRYDAGRPLTTRYTYDSGGRRQTVRDPLNRLTTYGYDDWGRLEVITDAVGGTTRYGYDLMSRLTSLTDAREKITTFTRDAFGRPIDATYPGSLRETFKYYPSGRLWVRTDRRGILTTFEYDPFGRLSRKVYSNGDPPATFTYDEGSRQLGRLTSASNGTDTLSWSYDLVGQRRSEHSALNALTVGYTYDPAGNRQTLTINGAEFLRYQYDDASRLKDVIRGASVFHFEYYDNHVRQLMTYPNGVSTTFAYDTAYRPRAVVASAGSTAVTSFIYTPDDVDNHLVKTGLDGTETYTYDALNRLRTATRPSLPPKDYVYDAAGNRVTEDNGALWTYTERNELLTRPGSWFTYDLNGNTATKAEGIVPHTYEWNAENELTRVLINGTEVARYAYDPLGRRVEKAVAGTLTRYAYDSEDILRSVAPGGAHRYVHGPGTDEPLAREDAQGTLAFYHADLLGSIVTVTDGAAATIETLSYDPYGNIEGAANGDVRYAFTAREWDAETGLYYYRARYYDPKIGRFLSEDPIGFQAGPNLYTYVSNNPTNLVDPTGLMDFRFDQTSPVALPMSQLIPKCRGALSARACSGLTTLTGRLDCACRCDAWKWRAQVSIQAQVSVYYATDSPVYTPAAALAHEMRHVAAISTMLQTLKSMGEQLEQRAFSSVLECQSACLDLKRIAWLWQTAEPFLTHIAMKFE
jgi:RHS repeat-associated protein